MSEIKNVALIGAGGNLGPAVLQALLDAKFNVTVLSRASSTATFPSSVHVQKVDYSSTDSLLAALKGQDAVVSTIASPGLAAQKTIVDAAVKAGVKRFIPSEFGVNTQSLEDSPGLKAILKAKIETAEYLKEVAASTPGFSWTGISTGLFFDWGLKVGSLGFNIPNKTATIFDSGNEPFQGTNLASIGAAIASVLQHPSLTANKYLRIASFTVTQNQILAILESETGTKWEVVKKSTDESAKVGQEKLAKGDYSAFGDFLKPYLFKDGHGHVASESELANGLLGLKKEDLKATLKAYL